MGSSPRKIIEMGDRAGLLRQCRNLKMARSADAYVRGNTVKFYEWLEKPDAAKVPQGPPIWICGDCHVGNLGPVADTKGLIDFEIRDLVYRPRFLGHRIEPYAAFAAG